MVARLFLENREQVSEFDAAVEEVGGHGKKSGAASRCARA